MNIIAITIIVFLSLLTGCASYKVVVQDCSPTENGDDWVCEKSIWGK